MDSHWSNGFCTTGGTSFSSAYVDAVNSSDASLFLYPPSPGIWVESIEARLIHRNAAAGEITSQPSTMSQNALLPTSAAAVPPRHIATVAERGAGHSHRRDGGSHEEWRGQWHMTENNRQANPRRRKGAKGCRGEPRERIENSLVESRYTGTLVFYDDKAGNGHIKVDPGYVFGDGMPVPAELRIVHGSVDTGGEKHVWLENLAVEFNIRKCNHRCRKGLWEADKVTLPGGVPIVQAVLENRQAVDIDGQRYCGTVKMWHRAKRFGFIEADPSMPLPPHVTARLMQQAMASAQRKKVAGQPEENVEELLYFRQADVKSCTLPEKGTRVSFLLYVDDRGAGACDIKKEDVHAQPSASLVD